MLETGSRSSQVIISLGAQLSMANKLILLTKMTIFTISAIVSESPSNRETTIEKKHSFLIKKFLIEWSPLPFLFLLAISSTVSEAWSHLKKNHK